LGAKGNNHRNRVFGNICDCNEGFWKNPVSHPTPNLRNRVFGNITDCNKGFSKKPGFSPPHTSKLKKIAIARPKKMNFTDNKLTERTIPNPKSP